LDCNRNALSDGQKISPITNAVYQHTQEIWLVIRVNPKSIQ
jgi:hypothetical protein